MAVGPSGRHPLVPHTGPDLMQGLFEFLDWKVCVVERRHDRFAEKAATEGCAFGTQSAGLVGDGGGEVKQLLVEGVGAFGADVGQFLQAGFTCACGSPESLCEAAAPGGFDELERECIYGGIAGAARGEQTNELAALFGACENGADRSCESRGQDRRGCVRLAACGERASGYEEQSRCGQELATARGKTCRPLDVAGLAAQEHVYTLIRRGRSIPAPRSASVMAPSRISTARSTCARSIVSDGMSWKRL